ENPAEIRPYLSEIKGIVPSLTELPHGCAFAPRCRYKTQICEEERPPIEAIDGGHAVACYYIKFVVAV
ncbi:MAG: oligopeptide/dipeptide ABC transporter ATP-binding protein, partial [Sneathiella sp.]